MYLRYAKFDPNGNVTILVLDEVPRERQARVAEQMMRNVDLQAEQVGFLEKPQGSGARVRLQMMGGEFCGNATMSVAAWLAQQDGVAQQRRYLLEVSGAEQAIDCSVIPVSEGRFKGEAPMPLPEAVLEAELVPGIKTPLVRFPGILHAILPEGSMNDAQAEELISSACAALGAEAMGLIFVNEGFDRIRPLVYVRETQSCVWESGCGSGTAALGAWRAATQQKDVDLQVMQACPENSIGVSAGYKNGRVCSLRIRGNVRLMESGRAWVEDEERFS